jgi:lysophospholipase L1-like esterase
MSTEVQPLSIAPKSLPRRSRARVWAFRMMSLCFAAGVLLSIEGLLWLLGCGQSLRLVEPVPGHPRVLRSRLNSDVDQVYFGTQPMQGPEPRRFELPKPAGRYRILFLGASTVIGFPYAPELAFPRQVELMLEAQQPGLEVESLNAGITAINSFEIADLAAFAAECEPDLVVIHAGHNEFFGPGGPGSTVLPIPPPLLRLTFALRRTRIGQSLTTRFGTPPDNGVNPLEKFPRLTGIRLRDPEFDAAMDNYERNLRIAVSRLRSQGLPVLLTTVACNLRDQPPIKSIWPPALSPATVELLERGLNRVEEHLASEQPQAALDRLLAMAPEARESANWQFRQAQALERLDRPQQAAAAYSLARDLDGCRFRAPSHCGEIVRSVWRELLGPDVHLLDWEQHLTESSSGNSPGSELFLEHVHYNQAGHRLLAERLSRWIVEHRLRRPWRVELELQAEELGERLGLTAEDELSALSFALEAVQTTPLSGALDNSRTESRLLNRIEDQFQQLNAIDRELFADLTLGEMQVNLPGALTRAQVKSGNLRAALRFARVAVKRKPWEPEEWADLARVCLLQDAKTEARAAISQGLQLASDEPTMQQLTDLNHQTTAGR